MTEVAPLTNQEARTLIDTVGSNTGLHSEKVLDWRQHEFERLGYATDDASALAETRIDIHDMQKLLDSGCPRELAWRILMGTMWSGSDPLWIESDEGGYMDVPLVIDDEE